ncbi:hypothetical protein Dvina_14145 [Dactylosporangium vinaceum]|uniref:Uncharacterized protein n=1 Tax=Dactylosporangium vinaceum TaxID=53362 RepID=A0ABV5MIF7_9ACTN|nr:hypothetical protein [Dactylosporangium vinaceum]UAB99111.1 hypothetical protein Dvina_14145 [Dactylosporangium vinaceum]
MAQSRGGDFLVEDWLAMVAGLAVVVVFCGCAVRWSALVPPDDGAGPYRTPERVHTVLVVVGVLGLAAVVLAARAWWADAGASWFSAGALVTIAAMLLLGLYMPRVEAQIVADGFGDTWYGTDTDGRFSLYNTTGEPVTVCLGLSGDCDSGAPGPSELRSPGLTIPAGHRRTVRTPGRAGDFKLTLVGPGISHRDAILHTEVPPSS